MIDPGAVGAGALALSSVLGSAASNRELLVGNIDTEWADANEVVVERIVGQISLSGASTRDFVTLSDIGDGWGTFLPVVRLGLVVVEDTDDGPTATSTPSLLQFDDIQDGEWMWLFQLGSPNETHLVAEGEVALRTWSHDISLDVRVKRKLGRRDRLMLVHDWAVRGNTFGFDHAVNVHPFLRCLVSTK